jgi:hypothetical protein
MTLTGLEWEVMRLLLTGRHTSLAVLRRQFELCSMVRRELTGVGFYTMFNVPEVAPRLRLRPTFSVGDVYGKVADLVNPVGFVLFVEDGSLNYLEGYTHDEQWPKVESPFEVSYDTGTKQRNLNRLLSKLPPDP